MKKSILVSLILLAIGLLILGWKKHPINYIDPKTISSIDSGLGEGGLDMGYVWTTLPPNVEEGATMYFSFNNGAKQLNSQCEVKAHYTRSFFYCQASWPESIAQQENAGYQKSNYTIKVVSKDNYLIYYYKKLFSK